MVNTETQIKSEKSRESKKSTVQTYARYKDSGVSWIGRIPEHWEVKKLKYLINSRTGYAFPSDKFALSDAEGIPVVRISDLDTSGEVKLSNCPKLPVEYAEYIRNYGLKNGDILFAMTGGTIGKVAVYKDSAKALLNQRVCSFTIEDAILRQIIFAWMNTKYWKDFIDLNSIGGAQPNISDIQVLNLPICIPPLPEQQTIATFLDDKTAKIDRAIAQKEKMISLLKERKQIIIQDLVTGKKVWNEKEQSWTKPQKTKDSGVEWIGEIPEEWEVKRLKNIANINLRVLPENFPGNAQIEYVDIGSVSFENGIERTELFVFKSSPSRARRIAKEGDTVISTVRTYLKAIDFVEGAKSKYIYSTGFAVLQPKQLESKFLFHLVRSNSFTEQVTINSKGMSYPAINSNDLSKLFVAVPSKNEQQHIIDYIELESTKIDHAISLQEHAIEKLKEYKTVLIDAAVTGKMKIIDY